MNENWVKLWRKSLDSMVFQDPVLWKTWSWCLMKATYKDRHVPVQTGRGETIVSLNPGQFIFGRKTASKELRLPSSTVRNKIKKLELLKNISVKPDTHFSVITIVNWNGYQQSQDDGGQAKDRQRTPKGQAKDTNKKVKKVKKVKNKIFIPPTLDEVKAYFKEKNFPESLAEKAFEYYNTADWRDSKGNKVKNWKQKMLAVWMKEENKEKSGDIKNAFKRFHNRNAGPDDLV